MRGGRVHACRDATASELACSGGMNSVLGTEQVVHKCYPYSSILTQDHLYGCLFSGIFVVALSNHHCPQILCPRSAVKDIFFSH